MIWCVEDDTGTREIELYTLASTGFKAQGFDNGNSFWNALQNEIPDLVILDVMLPGMDGIELLKKMKSSSMFCSIPVIMATAKGTEYDKIQSLDLGADDYLVKPFGMMEMVSRIKAVLRRCNAAEKAHLLKCRDLVVNTDERTVCISEQRINLTYKEFELLKMFMSHPNIAFTREQLFSGVWNMDYMGESRTLDMHIRTLRMKLGVYGSCIQTVRNIGYRWEALYDR